jgi:hypothetical protein
VSRGSVGLPVVGRNDPSSIGVLDGSELVLSEGARLVKKLGLIVGCSVVKKLCLIEGAELGLLLDV